MPGSVHPGSDLAAAASLATVLASLWIGDRLLAPVRRYENCRREVQASLVVAFALRDTVVRLAGKDDIGALNALADARRDLNEEAELLETLAKRPSLSLRLYAGLSEYRLEQAAEGLRQLSNSLLVTGGGQATDRAAVEAALRLGPRCRSGRVWPLSRLLRG